MKRATSLVLVIFLSVGVLAAASPFLLPFPNPRFAQAELQKFNSYHELRAFLNSKANFQGPFPFRDAIIMSPLAQRAGLATLATSAEAFSSTNIQVAGVDEADIVKTDGKYLYLVSGSRILIVKAYPAEEAALFSAVNASGYVQGLFINKDRLVVFVGGFPFIADCIRCGGIAVDRLPGPYVGENVTIQVYDITDRASSSLVKQVSVMGGYVNSRMIGDYVYVVVNAPASPEVLPQTQVDGVVGEIAATQIYYSNVTDVAYSYSVVTALNVQNLAEDPTFTTILTGATSTIYVSVENIYLTMTDYSAIPISDSGQTIPVEETVIHRLEILGKEVTPVASDSVPGHPLNQFSMDEYDSHFRIATTIGWGDGSKNNLYVLDKDLNIIGKIEDMALGESIYSVRFMGNRAYVVTFLKVDPLFVIDVSDPSNPGILGQLKIPGFSSYLHPYDENHLIGIGKDAAPADEGNFAWFQGLKISLFDVSDVGKPKEIANLNVGDRGTDSPILYDHRALLFDKGRNMLVIPLLLAEIDETKYPGHIPPDTYGDFVFQGAYVFEISPSSGITVRDRVTHLPDSSDLLKSGFYFDSGFEVKRSLYIGEVLYTVSDKKVVMNDMATLQKLSEVELPN